MKRRLFFCILALVWCFHFQARANVLYVNAANSSPAFPYATWATAATNIQDAVSFANLGDTVLVTNGFYQYGGASYDGSNRVYVANSATVQSVNGPAVTTIVGYQMPGNTNGVNAIRCVFLSSGATLSGFTVTNGATEIGLYGGGIWGPGATITNCIIVNNTDWGGAGGVQDGTLYNCVISNNFAVNCGGIEDCTAFNCLLTGNSLSSAAESSTLYNCTIAGNSSRGLAAAQGCTLYNSIIYGNSNGFYADCYQCRLTNCCTTIGNGNGPMNSTCLSNSPGFINPSGDYHLYPWSHCLAAGSTAYVSNSIDLDGNPRTLNGMVDMGCYENQNPLQNPAHYVSLTSTNPVAPYTNWLTAATNIQVAIGVAQPGDFVIVDDGVYTNGWVQVNDTETNVVALTNAITLVSAGGAPAAMIEGSSGTRCAYVGSNAVLMGFTLTNGNGPGIGGLNGGGAWCATGGTVSNCYIVGNVSGNQGGGVYGGAIYNCIITNNNYEHGAAARAFLYNCLVISNGWRTGSENGGGLFFGIASNCVIALNRAYSGGAGVYGSTVYDSTISGNASAGGYGAGAYQSQLYNCSVLTNADQGAYECILSNCVVSGSSFGQGGGTYLCTNYNCLISGNSGSTGGGADGGYLFNCILAGNTASSEGGGAYNATLYNCTVISNAAATSGGGTYNGFAYNSILYYNTAPSGSNYSGASLYYCCTVPSSTGQNCISNPPVFVNLGGGDYHQQTSSPTINDGDNFYDGSGPFPTNSTDFDGNPRIVGGTVDIGAYEYQGSNYNLPIPVQWLIQYGLPINGSADYAYSDGSGMNNWQKWIAGLAPFNSASVLAMSSPANNSAGITVTWQSVTTREYFLQCSTNLAAQPAFWIIQSNLVGQAGSTSFTDTNAVGSGPYFYRVGVQ